MTATLAYAGACYYCHQALLVHTIRCTCPNCRAVGSVCKLVVDAEYALQPQIRVAWHRDCEPAIRSES